MLSQHSAHAEKLPIMGDYSNKYFVYLAVTEAAQRCYHDLSSKSYSCIIVNTVGEENNNYFLHSNSVYNVIITNSLRLSKLLYLEGREELLPLNGSYIDALGAYQGMDLLALNGSNQYPKQFGNVLRETTMLYLTLADKQITMGGSELESLMYLGHPDIDVTTGFVERGCHSQDTTIDLDDFVRHANLLSDSVIINLSRYGDTVTFNHRGLNLTCRITYFETMLYSYISQNLYIIIIQSDKPTLYINDMPNAWIIRFRDAKRGVMNHYKVLTLIDNRKHYLPIKKSSAFITHESVMKTLFIRLNYMKPGDYDTKNRVLVAYFSPSNTSNDFVGYPGIEGVAYRLDRKWDNYYINCPSQTSCLYPGVSFSDNNAKFYLNNNHFESFTDMRRLPSSVMPRGTIIMESIKFLRLLESMTPAKLKKLDSPYHKVWDIIIKDKKFYEMSELQTVTMSQTGYVRYVGVKLRQINSVRYICSTDLYDIRGKVVSGIGLARYNGGDINGHVTVWPLELVLTDKVRNSLKLPIPVFVAGHHMYMLIGSVLGTPVCISSLYNQINYHFSLMKNGGRTRLSKRMSKVKDYLMEYDDGEVTLFHSPLEMYLGLLAGCEIIKKFFPLYMVGALVLAAEHVKQLNILLKNYPWSVRVSDSVKDVDQLIK